MAKNPKQPVNPTKKHMARMQREALQTRYLLIGSVAVFVLVLALVGYGILDQAVLKSRRPVAVVNGDRIMLRDFQAQTRFQRSNMVQQVQQTYQFAQLFGQDPSMAYNFVSQLQQIQFQMSSPETVGQQVLDSMIEDKLIRQEAARRGITVSEAEVDKSFEEAFGFYPDGTPTPSPTVPVAPTSTLSPLQMTLTAPTATPILTATATTTTTTTEAATPTQEIIATEALTGTAASPAATEVLTPTATPSPTPSPTPYTREGYEGLKSETVQNYKDNFDVSEADLHYVLESQLYRQKVMEAVLAEMNIGRVQEQVWAQHILLPDLTSAQDVRSRLDAGEPWCQLAADLSQDTSNSQSCGDLGWFSYDTMVEPFSEAAFAMEVGQISEPISTTNGYHIIQVLGHEDRPLSDSEYEDLRNQKFSEWLDEQRTAATIETRDEVWQANVPDQPAFPAEVSQWIESVNAAIQSQQEQLQATQQALPAGTPQATEEPAQ